MLSPWRLCSRLGCCLRRFSTQVVTSSRANTSHEGSAAGNPTQRQSSGQCVKGWGHLTTGTRQPDNRGNSLTIGLCRIGKWRLAYLVRLQSFWIIFQVKWAIIKTEVKLRVCIQTSSTTHTILTLQKPNQIEDKKNFIYYSLSVLMTRMFELCKQILNEPYERIKVYLMQNMYCWFGQTIWFKYSTFIPGSGRPSV